MNNKLFLMFILFLILFLISSCEIKLGDEIESSISDNKLELAENYNYGFGTFGNPAYHLTNNDGNLLINGIDFFYDQTLVNIYDTNDTYGFENNKYFKIIENGLNVSKFYGLNLDPIAKDLSVKIISPPKDKIYIDPINGSFILPSPNYWSKCENVSDLDITSEINRSNVEVSGDVNNETVIGVFRNGLKANPSIPGDNLQITGINNEEIFGGTVSLWWDPNSSYSYLKIIIGNVKITYDEYYKCSRIFIDNIEVAVSSSQIWNTWEHFYVIVGDMSDNKTVKVFKNNVEIVSSNNNVDLGSTSNVIVSCGTCGTGKYGDCNIDNIKIWNHVVSETSSWIFNNGIGIEGALHEIYGLSNDYIPNMIEVAYYK